VGPLNCDNVDRTLNVDGLRFNWVFSRRQVHRLVLLDFSPYVVARVIQRPREDGRRFRPEPRPVSHAFATNFRRFDQFASFVLLRSLG
jgi:hypothetical protein